jgi:hypothetical protein
MQRWQLKKKYLFVDALKHKKPQTDDYTTELRKPQDIPYAHVLDKSNSPDDNGPAPSPYVAINSGAGFIARFIVQGVDTDELLPQILVSEYGIPLQQAKDEVNAVLTMLKDCLRGRKHQRDHEPPALIKKDVHPTGKYDLDYKVNFFGIGFLKGPL